MNLLADVVAALAARGMQVAVIGATAMAAHGVARATTDVDLLLAEVEALKPHVWEDLRAGGAQVEIRRGEVDDPLTGVIRIRRDGESPIDVVIGNHPWQRRIVERAVRQKIHGTSAPVATRYDLILLKLYAGSPQDRWDIARLIDESSDPRLVGQVEQELTDLPAECAGIWQSIVESRN
ncbi:MAG TPA: nucleotidyl transferase AbiEii/AbiGii toxin family protein [Candidatus Binatia bacterium]|jgi:hypothetical protein